MTKRSELIQGIRAAKVDAWFANNNPLVPLLLEAVDFLLSGDEDEQLSAFRDQYLDYLEGSREAPPSLDDLSDEDRRKAQSWIRSLVAARGIDPHATRPSAADLQQQWLVICQSCKHRDHVPEGTRTRCNECGGEVWYYQQTPMINCPDCESGDTQYGVCGSCDGSGVVAGRLA